MSFGWSAGDIVAAANLVNRIIKSVGNVGGAQEHFQELETELLSLSKALHEISVLTSEPGQIPEIVALKFVACLCEDTLKRFYEKIKPFDATLSIEAKSGMRKGKTVPKMVRWELLVKKDIPELRSYLVAHVGSLTLRLNTALLKVASRSFVNATQNSATLQDHLHIETRSICEKINLISKGDTIPRLDSLLTIATQVWKPQSEMIEMFSTVLRKLPDPDIRHTWAQAPVRFEDALGRVIPIPSEYDWDKIEAVIQTQFKRGPGNQKVRSREYELYDGTFADIAIIKEQNFCPIPGMSIVMAFILGQYAGSEYCPRLGCKSKSFKRQGISIESTVCTECQSWFRTSNSALPKPLKPPGISDHSFNLTFSEQSKGFSYPSASHRDRRTYKNLSIYITELPPTPKHFRDKYHRTREPGAGRRRHERQYPAAVCNRGRPQTNQMSYVSQYLVPNRPHTLGFIDTEGATPSKSRRKEDTSQSVLWSRDFSASDKVAQQWIADIDQYEIALEEMAVATLDQDYRDELSGIEQ